MKKSYEKNQNEVNMAIATYAIRGILSENYDLAIDRLIALFTNKPEQLGLLVTGVPLSAKVVNEEKIINSYDDVKSIKSASIDNDFNLIIKAFKIKKRYFKTQEEADKAGFWDGNNKYSEETPICKEFEYTDNLYFKEEIADAVEIEYL